jgi:hypothetical protein
MGLDLRDQVTVFFTKGIGRKAYSRDCIVEAFEIEIFYDANDSQNVGGAIPVIRHPLADGGGGVQSEFPDGGGVFLMALL